MSFRHRHNQSLRYNYSSAPRSPSHQSVSSSKPSSNHQSPRHFNYSTEHLTAVPPQTTLTTSAAAGGSGTITSGSNANITAVKTSATCSLASSRESSTSNPGAHSYK